VLALAVEASRMADMASPTAAPRTCLAGLADDTRRGRTVTISLILLYYTFSRTTTKGYFPGVWKRCIMSCLTFFTFDLQGSFSGMSDIERHEHCSRFILVALV
jgi:hypothetical protein